MKQFHMDLTDDVEGLEAQIEEQVSIPGISTMSTATGGT